MTQSSPTETLQIWVNSLAAALNNKDGEQAAALFAEDGYWRDLIALTWNIKTFEGPKEISEMLKNVLKNVEPKNCCLDGEATEADGVIEGWVQFETATATGYGHVRLKDGKCWTFLTTMQALKGHEEKKGRNRINGTEHGVVPGRKTWLELKTEQEKRLGYEDQPYCLIIGGGQGGIGLGARLRRLGVPTLIIESNPRAGDSWRNRYRSLCLHDPVWYDHMPYLPFPDDWPIFTPKDKMGDWLESYVKIMELNYWTSSLCKSASFDQTTGVWTVIVEREGKKVVLKPKHLVLATGMAGVPLMPELEGASTFGGSLIHSSKFKSGKDYQGKKCVIVGSNNSAHDIAADLWENGADVTMLQRSSTHVSKSETLRELGSNHLYSEDALERGIDTEKADLLAASVPYRLMGELQKPVYEEMKRRDKDFYDKLEKAGFMLDFGDDESGLFMKYMRRGSGYYIDVGASELIINGDITLKQGQISSVTSTGAKLESGEEVEADLIVCATGYGSMNGWAEMLINKDVADKVGKVWGLGSDTTKDPGPWEGEPRNMWKPTQQENLWFHGGNLHQSRHYSKYLSLQLKARMEGIATPVYGLQDVHHKS